MVFQWVAEVGMRRWWLMALGALLVSEHAAAGAPAAITVTAVERPRPGWVRVVTRDAGPARPAFRVTPLCAAARGMRWVVAAQVRVFARGRRAIVELRDDLGWLADWTARCAPTALALEMVESGSVLAMVELPIAMPSPLMVARPAPPPAAAARVGLENLDLEKTKHVSPEAQMAEAGLRFSVTPRVAVQLGYTRTALGGAVPHDPDNGVRTSLRIGF
jgi:hypothetical protein